MHKPSNIGSSNPFAKRMFNVGVIGSGNSAHALAAWLSSQGHAVTIYARNLAKLSHVEQSESITSRGQLEGTFPIRRITDSAQILCENTDVIFVATLATAYSDVARQLAPYISSHHCVVLFSGKLCGCLEMSNAFAVHEKSIPVIETDSIFACRLQEDGSIWLT
ncbi:MAG: NAD(P)-binding domain-containing protein [Proteobacteria bacterium]|nr:NAD(P)-binding domain-containing protein [Pseudomonadota bacterium]